MGYFDNTIVQFARQIGLNLDGWQYIDFATEDEQDLKLIEVYDKDFDVADGEEGTNGIIRYYIDGLLIVERIIHGGDDEDYEFTVVGVDLLSDIVKNIIERKLKKLKTI